MLQKTANKKVFILFFLSSAYVEKMERNLCFIKYNSMSFSKDFFYLDPCSFSALHQEKVRKLN
jgi:hypothetical protein